MDKTVIARRLVELRGKKSRKEVAFALGVSISGLTMYEHGCRVPRDEIKRRIASYYGKSVEEIFFTD